MKIKMFPEVPKTKQEAFEEIDDLLNDDERKELLLHDAYAYHFSLGLWIRNNWIHKQKEKEVLELAKLFRVDPILFDPDDLSGKIIIAYQRYLKNKKYT